MEAVTIQHEQDEERFNKIQINDNHNFEEQINTLQVGFFIFIYFYFVSGI